ncbi:MAG: S-layer homology domain-containing protein [Candidatus Pelethousia sp.]|nr:S-layer homology domain-containing protein [Candidatus Pelethousia sp.]
MKRSNKHIPAALLCLILLLGAPQSAAALSPANVAKDRPVTVSATEDAGSRFARGTVLPYTGARAVDGSTADYSYWYTTGATKTLTVALAAPVKIDRWVVTGIDKNGQTDLYPSDFKLDVSADGAAWTTVDAVTGNTARICDRSFDAITAAYVRLDITKGNQRNDNWVAISEFAVYEEVVNSAPISAASPQTLLVGETVDFTASDIATDADGDVLTITQIVTAPSSDIATAALNAGTVTITGKTAGSTSVVVRVSDGKDMVDASVTITVKARTYILSWVGTASAFDDLSYGYSSGSSASYTVKNTGNSEVTGITANITAGGDNFTVSSAPGSTLAPNATATVTVSSKPGLAAASLPYTGMLTITWASGGSGITQLLSQKVDKANNTLSISCANISFGQAPAPTVVTNTSGGAIAYEYKVQGAGDDTYSSTVPTGVGSYTVRGTSAATANYNAAIATAGFTIAKANNTLSISCANITFGQTPAPTVVTNTSGGAVAYEYKAQGATDTTYSDTVPTEAGSYTVRGTSAATANYNAAIATANFAIGKANNTLSISCANITFGQTPVPTIVTNISGGAVAYEYKVQGAGDDTYTSTVPTGAGRYTVRGTSAATANYNAGAATANFTIGKANNTLSITCADINYGTAPAPSAVTNISGGTVTYEYKALGSGDDAYTVTVPTQSGDYVVRATSAATSNYNAATAIAYFSIHKATPTLALTADPAGTRARPGSVALTAALPDDATGTLTFLVGTDSIAAVTLPVKTASFTPTTVTNTYGFAVEYSGDDNYNSAASATLTYHFTKSNQAALNTADGTVSYGSTLDLSALVSGGSGTGSISFAVTGGPGEINGAILTPTGAGNVDMTVTKAADNDYNAKSTSFKVTVTPRVVTFSVAPVAMQAHTGSAVTPKPEVKDGSIVLTEGLHFTYSYDNNTDVGTSAAIHITGIGSYAGSTGCVTFTIGGAIPTIIMPPAVGGTVYVGTALSQITLTGGEANVGGHFEWVSPLATAVYGSNTFEARFLPDDPVLYTQVTGINVTFNAVNRPSGGDDSSSWERKPDQPMVAGVTAAAQAANGIANANIPDKSIADAIAKAQAEARAQGKTANGIAVSLNITLPRGASSLATTLTQNALRSLVGAGVNSLTINGAAVRISFDLKALQEIQKQSSDNITISIVATKNLPKRAKALIGARPVYDITVSYVKDGRTIIISAFNGGLATISISYMPGRNETAGWLFGVYVDGKGNANRILGSVYDTNSGRLLIPTGHLSMYGVGYTAPAEKYTDTANHWAKESIDYVVGRGLVSGIAKKTFAPNMVMDRGMIVTALGRLAGVDVSAYKTSSFSDVAVGKYYLPYVEWAYQNDIISGTGDGKFAPERAVTREEIALILQNYAKITGYKLPVTREAITFVDAYGIGGSYAAAVKAMQQAGIIMGKNGNRFNPKAGSTRAEVAAMLHRYVKLTIDPTTAQGWALNDDGGYMYYKDGKALIGAQSIDGAKYFFDAAGTLKTGWVKG